MNELPKLVLASGSPRRAEILRSVGWDFVKDVPETDESEIPGESPELYVQRLAQTKAEAIAAEHAGEIVLGADTTVVLDGQSGGVVGQQVVRTREELRADAAASPQGSGTLWARPIDG